ncbi:MAG: ABC transporter permease [Clostridiales bacterium]|jgi:oligopeptide transport system permease protein|nr:ABC transporter permease [Clostridiales bacterium]
MQYRRRDGGMGRRAGDGALGASGAGDTAGGALGALGPAGFAPAPIEDRQGYMPRQKSVGYWGDAWRRLRRNTVSMVSLLAIALLLCFAFIGPQAIPYKYDQQIRTSLNLAPMQHSEAELAEMAGGARVFPHFFGTDTHGRDTMARAMVGARVSVAIGIIAALLVLLIGSIYGAIAGFFGGIADAVMMRVVEVISSLPDVLVVLLIAVSLKPALDSFVNANRQSALAGPLIALGPSIVAIFIAFAMLYWVTMARIIRGNVLQLKEQEFVLAARALGASSARIIRKHLLPNCIGSMIAATCLEIPTAIFLESFLSFLGVGVQAPLTSLGSMCSDALGGINTYPHRLVIPALVLLALLLSFNLLGDGLRDALDPRLKK